MALLILILFMTHHPDVTLQLILKLIKLPITPLKYNNAVVKLG